MELQDEIILVKKAQTDPQAFSEIYELYYSKIFNYVLKRVMDLETAQDITSEVFIKAFKSIWQFRFRKVPFVAWLYRIASNEINNYLKKNYYKTISLDQLLMNKGYEPILEGDPQKEMLLAEKTQSQNKEFFEMQTIMRKLPLHFQTIISLKFFEKKSLKEMSTRLLKN